MSELKAIVDDRDVLRLRQRLGDQSVSDWLRGLINDDLEASGEPLLREGRRAAATPMHGTLTSYNFHHCRCRACRDAVRDYQARRRAS